jgi:hypothetical protein
MTKGLVAALALEMVFLATLGTIAADQIAHTRVEKLGGVNVWGYRGQVAHQRQPHEIRIVFVGGTRTFGWGAAASETVPAAVRWMVTLTTDRPHEELRPIVAVNLGTVGADAFTYASTLGHFGYLQSDYICIYDDLGREATRPSRRSLIFSAFGYAPALPLVLEEKGMALQYGSVRAGYGDGSIAAPPLIHRVAGRLFRAVGAAARRLDESVREPAPGAYADHMIAAVDVARRQARGVIIAVGPAETDRERQNLRALRSRLADRLARERAIRVIDLSDVSELTRRDLMLDGYNYGAEGRARVAGAITPALLEMIAADASSR